MSYNPTESQVLDYLHHKRSSSFLDKISNYAEANLFPGAFSDLSVEGLENIISEANSGKQFVFVQDHQSEYDWVIAQPKLHQAGLPVAIQAGANLFVGPIGAGLKKLGGYMSVRDDRKMYGENGFSSLMREITGQKPHIITQEEYSTLLPKQLERILVDEKLHNLTLPNIETNKYDRRKKKLGRSYSGKLNPLHPGVFMAIDHVAKNNNLDNLNYVPVYVSYERTPEDILFREFEGKFSSKVMKNVYDHYYTFVKFPRSKEIHEEKPRAILRFGEPRPALGNTVREHKPIIESDLGSMLRVYPTHLVFASMDNYYKMSKSQLTDRLNERVEVLESQDIDTSALRDLEGNLIPLDDMLGRVESLFNYTSSPRIAGKTDVVLEHDEKEVFIWHPHLARFYSNRLNHLLKKGQK